MKGKIYFVAAPGRIKIGYTVNPDGRLQKLRNVDMEELTVLAVIDGTRRLEKHLHSKLAPFWLKGEWFLDCAAVRAAMGECLSSKNELGQEKEANPASALNEAAYVTLANELSSKLIRAEKRNGASTNEALTLVAIKTGLSHNRVWQLQYRRPKSVTAAEIFALKNFTSSDHVASAQALVREIEGQDNARK